MINVSCNHCSTVFSLSEYNYAKRKRSNKNDSLFCSRKCSGNARKTVVPTITTGEQDLDEWFKFSTDDIIIGGGSLTTNNNMGGSVILSSEESNVMAQENQMIWLGKMVEKNPKYLTMTIADIIIAEGKEQGAEVSSATPIAPAQPTVVTPAQSNIVKPVQSSTVNPTQPMNQPPTRWQDSLDDKEILNSICDADFWDAAKTMKKCNLNPEAKNQFRYSVIDPVNGLIFTQNGRICYRCQGRGYLTLRNLGYNWESDIKYKVISASITFSQYVESKNETGVVLQIPVGM